ncbi:MAG: hypothetical protein ACLUL2_02160 [Blautia sp.]
MSAAADVINPKTKGNIILYSDFADFYAEEGLSYRELLLKRMESGQADDLYIIPAEDVLEFDQKGFIYDLSDLDCISSLSEDALRQSTYNEKVFSVPLSYTGFGLIWNVDMLRQYRTRRCRRHLGRVLYMSAMYAERQRHSSLWGQ